MLTPNPWWLWWAHPRFYVGQQLAAFGLFLWPVQLAAFWEGDGSGVWEVWKPLELRKKTSWEL